MGVVDGWDLRVVLACLRDWKRETVGVPWLDLERCLAAAGFVVIRESARLRLWRNPVLGEQYSLQIGFGNAPPAKVAEVRDLLIQILARNHSWSDD